MIPVDLIGSETTDLKNPITGATLKCIAARGLVFTAWRMTREERAQFEAGAPVWVAMHGEQIPVFNLVVGDRSQVIPQQVVKAARRRDAQVNSPEFKAKLENEIFLDRAAEWLARTIAAVIVGSFLALAWSAWRFWFGR